MLKNKSVMSVMEYQASQKKQSKYNNTKVLYNGIAFDSQLECKRYQQLVLLEKAGLISNLVLQVRYELQPAFTYQGKRVRAIEYISDFQYVENGITVLEDTKGYTTKDFLLKEKMLKYRYPHVEFRRITKV